MFERLRQRNEWKFFGVMPKASFALAIAWWTALLLRGLLPVAFAIATGVLVGAVQRGGNLAGPLALSLGERLRPDRRGAVALGLLGRAGVVLVRWRVCWSSGLCDRGTPFFSE